MKHIKLDKSTVSQDSTSLPEIGNFKILTDIATLPGVYIIKTYDFNHYCTDSLNEFLIYKGDSQGAQVDKSVIFKAQEVSSYCSRTFLTQSYSVMLFIRNGCRPYQLTFHSKDSQDSILQPTATNTTMVIKKQCQCVYLCCNRPNLQVYLTQGNDVSQFAGTIDCPYVCYNRKVTVYDKTGSIKYIIVADFCQIGFFCSCPCQSCQKIIFNVTDSSGNNLCQVTKISPGYWKASCTALTCFQVPFPPNATPEEKALLVAATVLIDYTYTFNLKILLFSFFPSDFDTSEDSSS